MEGDVKKKKDGDKKNTETKKNGKGSQPSVAPAPNKQTGQSQPKLPAQNDQPAPIHPKLANDNNPIVTIRRHSNTPDANVTISVKGDNGEEDVLYTLVNGKGIRNILLSMIQLLNQCTKMHNSNETIQQMNCVECLLIVLCIHNVHTKLMSFSFIIDLFLLKARGSFSMKPSF